MVNNDVFSLLEDSSWRITGPLQVKAYCIEPMSIALLHMAEECKPLRGSAIVLYRGNNRSKVAKLNLHNQ